MTILAWFQSPSGSKLAASALLGAPIAILLLLGLGEMAGGDVTGVQHLVEVVPLLLLLIAAWRWPRVAGIALVCIGSIVLLVWAVLAVTASERASPTVWAIVGLGLFFPPLLAGSLLLRGSS